MHIATIDLIVNVNGTGSCRQSNGRPAVDLVSNVDACACPEQDIRRTIVDLVAKADRATSVHTDVAPSIDLLVAGPTDYTDLDIAGCGQGNPTPSIDLALDGHRSTIANQRHRAPAVDLALNEDIIIVGMTKVLTTINVAWIREHASLLLSLAFALFPGFLSCQEFYWRNRQCDLTYLDL
jgi:hypothetical protein